MLPEKPDSDTGPGEKPRRKPARATFMQRLAALIRRKSNALEVLRELVRLQKAKFEELRAEVNKHNPGLDLKGAQLARVLKWSQEHGLVFKNPDPKYPANPKFGHYHPTSLAYRRVWDEGHVDWLAKACMAHAIIADPRPDANVLEGLEKELHLDRLQAEKAFAALDQAPRRLQLPRLRKCLRRGGKSVLFVPTKYPNQLRHYDLRINRDAVDEKDLAVAERIYAPRMDSVAERVLLNALRHADYDEEEPGRVVMLPMYGDQFLDACTSENQRVFRPRHSVVSISSPKVNPFALDLMLRYESPISFIENLEAIKLEPVDMDKGDREPYRPALDTADDCDYAILLRFVDFFTRRSHFVVAGLYPPGPLGAALYFRKEIDNLLHRYRDAPFGVILKTNRPGPNEWVSDDALRFEAVETVEFPMVETEFNIDIRYEPGIEVLLWLCDKHPEYYRKRLGEEASSPILDRHGHRLKKANQLMGLLQRKNILLEGITDALLIDSFYKLDKQEQKEFVEFVRNHTIARAAKHKKWGDAFKNKVLDYTWNMIDEKQEFLHSRLDTYAFFSGTSPAELVNELCNPAPAPAKRGSLNPTAKA